MMSISSPIYTREVRTNSFSVPAGSTFLSSLNLGEDRALPAPSWFAGLNEATVAIGTLDSDAADNLKIDLPHISLHLVISLFERDDLAKMLQELPQPVYLDITGLSHRMWAPLVAASSVSAADVRLIYVEPAEYLGGTFKDSQRIYDLSTKFEGMRPLPGFSYLSRESDDDEMGTFVPMVGFEGSRLAYVLSQVEPDFDKTFPVVGVPGFRPDYAFYAYEANRRSLERAYLFKRVQYAKANCPFEAFNLLREIHAFSPDDSLRIAMIGTKPHALGAVLYALARPGEVELVYDNPVRKRDRTKGQARLIEYALSAFLRSELFREASVA